MATTPLDRLGRSAIEAKGWFQAHKWLLARRASQIGILALFLAGPYLGVWPIKGTLASSLVLDTVPLLDPIVFLQMLAGGLVGITTTALVGVAIVVAFYALVGGRVFCSWVCPLNAVTDTARWLRRRLGLKGGAKLRSEARWLMLAAVAAVAFATHSLAYELINPVAVLHRGIIFGFGLGWLLVAGVFLFDLLVAKDGWCGHLCPMGALYAAIGTGSLIRVRADARHKCDDCMECYEVCPEMQVIPPALKGARGEGPAILSADCTNCGRCIDICGQQVYRFGLRFPNRVPAAVGAAAEKEEETA